MDPTMTAHASISHRPVSALHTRMIEDMTVCGVSEKKRTDCVRNVRSFAPFVGR
jgi:integrase/recombinase XerD